MPKRTYPPYSKKNPIPKLCKGRWNWSKYASRGCCGRAIDGSDYCEHHAGDPGRLDFFETPKIRVREKGSSHSMPLAGLMMAAAAASALGGRKRR